MFKHILVTVDGTPQAEAVIPHAVDIARSMAAEITIIRIVEPVNSDWSERGALGKGQGDSSAGSAFTEQAEMYLLRLAATIDAAGVNVNTIVKQGQPARQIVATADEIDADAIAMSTHSRRGINRLMFGSVAEVVLHESNLPVILVRSA